MSDLKLLVFNVFTRIEGTSVCNKPSSLRILSSVITAMKFDDLFTTLLSVFRLLKTTTLSRNPANSGIPESNN